MQFEQVDVHFFFQVWRIQDNELVSVERKWLGHFYGGDCYLILYKYEVNNKMHYILYVWQVCAHVIPYLSQCIVHYITFHNHWLVIFVQAVYILYCFRVVMQARQNWQHLHIKQSFWTRSIMGNQCKFECLWGRSPCTLWLFSRARWWFMRWAWELTRVLGASKTRMTHFASAPPKVWLRGWRNKQPYLSVVSSQNQKKMILSSFTFCFLHELGINPSCTSKLITYLQSDRMFAEFLLEVFLLNILNDSLYNNID